MRRTQSILAALAAGLLLASAVSTASARSFSISNQNFRMTWTSMELGNIPAGVSVRCPVTQEGSYHARTIAKVFGSLIGHVTRFTVKGEACTGGVAAAMNGVERYNGTTTPNTLPWHIVYTVFAGTLPNIQEALEAERGVRVGVTIPGICTGQYGTAEDRLTFRHIREAGGGITSVQFLEGANRLSLFRRDGGLVCTSTGEATGNGSAFLLGTTTRITLTLI